LASRVTASVYNSCRVTVPGTFLRKKRTKAALLSSSIARPQGHCSQQPRKPHSARWILKDKYNSYQIPKGPNNARSPPSCQGPLHAYNQSLITWHKCGIWYNSVWIFEPANALCFSFSTYTSTFVRYHLINISSPFSWVFFSNFHTYPPFHIPHASHSYPQPAWKHLHTCFFAHAKQLEGPDAKGEFSTVSKASI